ncbi:MAG TPA: DSD1 family PLP-dependent enzyme [Gemmatimonadaceae bacterium]|jgi:D-serine deaminase-like pyridoxal phosphate-dependent protein
MQQFSARVGDSVASVATPALVIDLDAMERNLAAMAAFARSHGVLLRPHAKMHKSAAIAKAQIAAGAVGVCAQKVSEAEVLADAGIPDIFISNEVIDSAKLTRVAALADRLKLAIAVDSILGVDRLAQACDAAGSEPDVFVEIDVGQGRCGVSPAAAGALAHHVVSRGLRFAGLQAYQGGAQHVRGAADREAAASRATSLVRAAQTSIASAGISCPLVTGGGTGTFAFDVTSGVYGELQVGSYLFMDGEYAAIDEAEGAPRFEHALFVKSQVMSRSASHVVVDAGIKAYAIDAGLPRVWGRELEMINYGDEHGILKPGGSGTAVGLPQLGETIWLVPGHCDPTVNLYDTYVAVRGGLEQGAVEALWRVDTRGCMT